MHITGGDPLRFIRSVYLQIFMNLVDGVSVSSEQKQVQLTPLFDSLITEVFADN